MASKRPLLPIMILMLLGGAPLSSAEASTVYVGRLGYQSPTLVAPLLMVSGSTTETLRWHAGVLGWTLRGGLRLALGNQRHLQGELDITPQNSNGASYMYTNGELNPDAFFDNRTLLARVGMIFRHSEKSESRIFGLGLKEQVEHTDPKVTDYWRRPYLGVEFHNTYQSLRSHDMYLGRWDGFRAEGRAQLFVGDHTWSRFRAEAGAGRRHRRVFWMLRGVLLYGEGLTTVNRFLVGGGWEGPGINDLTGSHYAEFRVDQALLLHGAVDFKVAGDWELGLRSSVMGQAAKTPLRFGCGARLSTVLEGVGVILGASLGDDARKGGKASLIVHGALTLGVLD